MLSLLFVVSLGTAVYFFLNELGKELPDIDALDSIQYQTPLKIFSRDGLLIGHYGEKRRIPVAIKDVPQRQIQAFLAAEDDRFYSHPGVDFKGLLRAANQLATTGQKRQGGSTITMQVVRNFLLGNEKTFLRKIKEIMLALRIERRYGKDRILEMYLNKIYMGQRAYGVAAAAQTYYGKNLQELDLPQQAMIAGLPKAPSIYNPIANSERALERRNYVLRRMKELGHISQTDYETAFVVRDDARIQPINIQLDAPYVAEMARQELVEKYGEDAYTLGLSVYTTITSQLQITADQALRQALHIYDERHGYRGQSGRKGRASNDKLQTVIGDLHRAVIQSTSDDGIKAVLTDGTPIHIPWENARWTGRIKTDSDKRNFLKTNDLAWVRPTDDEHWALSQIPAAEGAFAAVNVNNGAILALSGGFDFRLSKYNRATQSKRQPGSGFKPFIYTAALEKGFTPASIINDAPLAIADPSQANDWRPENYTQRYLGPISLRVALKQSINSVSVRLLQSVGIPYAIETAMRFGFTREQLPGTFSLALGSGHATPLRMATAYSTFANGGYGVTTHLIERIENHDGHTLFQATSDTSCIADCPANARPATRILSEPVCFLMNSLLRDVVESGTATAAKQLGRSDLAGKTGTTNDQRDAWFNGYAGNIAASAWMGFDDMQPLGKGETGGKAALPMWMAFMKTALADRPEQPLEPPEGIVKSYINPSDGLLLDPTNHDGNWEYFIAGTEPKLRSPPKMPEFDYEDFEWNDEGLF
ncbi:MAG: penicillin-binding protein 1A [Methylomonas sp.]|nr:penicillin-binding protein 1A [Methylomonas sp.]PPD20742.1 MAG: peptidase [Methylomonas sp.]PPD25058.1 MAG: peptidase [Methylomonas sp.]PPD34374.1 MAG: peptidase [Methylomonas sp.]PPD38970.1 MAG: peptidase [Methylomonas sp.]